MPETVRGPALGAHWLVVVSIMVALLAGCGTRQMEADLQAEVQVNQRDATFTVQTSGVRVGLGDRDYHVHFALNAGPEMMLYSSAYTFRNLEPGRYKLQVWMSRPDHAPVEGVQQLLEFEVRG